MNNYPNSSLSNALRKAQREGGSTAKRPSDVVPAGPSGQARQAPQVNLTNSAAVQKARQHLQATTGAATPVELALAKERYEKWSKTVTSQESPITKAHRDRIAARWAVFICIFCPELPQESYWYFDVVKGNALLFLPFLIDTTPPRRGHKALKGATVGKWLELLVYCIVTYTRDPETGNKLGMVLLTQYGYFTKLEDQVVALTQERGLERTFDPKYYYGRPELQHIFQTMLAKTQFEGTPRAVVIQGVCRLLMTFYCTCRPSTLGPTHKKWMELRYFIKLGNIRVFHVGDMNYRIQINLEEFKGTIGASQVETQIFTFDNVQYAHNTLFDPVLWFLAWLFYRRAFVGNYASMSDLLADPIAELVIPADKMGEPLFLAVGPGGTSFTAEAAFARATSDTLATWAKASGLPAVGVYAIRRESTNLYSLLMGLQFAKDICNHHSINDGVLRRHYSRNTNNMAVVGLRTGEIKGKKESRPGEVLEKNFERHAYASAAVESLVRMQNRTPLDLDNAKEALFNQVEQMPEMVALQENLDCLIDAYLLCFTSVARSYQREQAQINRILKRAIGETVPKNNSMPVEFLPGKSVEAKMLHLRVTKAFEDINNARKRLRCTATAEEKHKSTVDMGHSVLTGTVEQRRKAIEEAQQVSVQLLEAVRAARNSSDAPTTDQDWRNKLLHLAKPSPVQDPVLADPFTNPKQWQQQIELMSAQHRIEDTDEFCEVPEAVNLIIGTCRKEAGRKGENPLDAVTKAPPPSKDLDWMTSTSQDVDESQETDVFKLPRGDVARAFLDYLLTPIMNQEAFERTKVTPEEIAQGMPAGYRCPFCTRYTHREVKVSIFRTMYKMRRHFAQSHSAWKDLELDMVREGSEEFHCPCGQFDGESVDLVRAHAVSDRCPRWVEHCAMEESHKEVIVEFQYEQQGAKRAKKRGWLKLQSRCLLISGLRANDAKS
ncbi:hypothetical protein BDZ97DRAFT_2076115 [Flammula alnicola]|nr:hypothetical protein BDZ97DRAFT_2076115 [Flammula alnicola]